MSSKKKILLVEDDRQESEAIITLLESAGYLATPAFSGDQGVKVAKAKVPDLILSETRLPRLDGFTMTKLLKSDKRFRHIPIILLTDHRLPKDLGRAEAVGASAYFVKPFDPPILIGAIERLLEGKPLSSFLVEPDGRAEAAREKPPKAPPSRPSSGKKLVLLIENEAEFARAVRGSLEAADFEVITAASGDRGLRLAKQEEPDLVLLEGILPGMNGYTVTRLLKADKRLQHVPVIILTALSHRADFKRGEEAKADAYLTKPFDPEKLLATINGLLEKSARKKLETATHSGPTWLDGIKRISRW